MPNAPPTSGVTTRTCESGKPELRRENIAHLVRHLMRMMDRQLPQARIEIGHDGARLKRHAGLPLEHEVMLDHHRGVGESADRDVPATKA